MSEIKKPLIILSSTSPIIVLKTGQAFLKAGYEVERFHSLSTIFSSAKLNQACIVILEIATIEDNGRAQEFLRSLQAANALKIIIYTTIKGENLQTQFTNFPIADFIVGPITERTAVFKVDLQQKILDRLESKKKSIEDFHVVATEKKTDGTIVLKVKGPQPQKGAWLLEPNAPESKIRWRWIANPASEKKIDVNHEIVFEGEQAPKFDEKTKEWILQAKEPILEQYRDGKIIYSSEEDIKIISTADLVEEKNIFSEPNKSASNKADSITNSINSVPELFDEEEQTKSKNDNLLNKPKIESLSKTMGKNLKFHEERNGNEKTPEEKKSFTREEGGNKDLSEKEKLSIVKEKLANKSESNKNRFDDKLDREADDSRAGSKSKQGEKKENAIREFQQKKGKKIGLADADSDSPSGVEKEETHFLPEIKNKKMAMDEESDLEKNKNKVISQADTLTEKFHNKTQLITKLQFEDRAYLEQNALDLSDEERNTALEKIVDDNSRKVLLDKKPLSTKTMQDIDNENIEKKAKPIVEKNEVVDEKKNKLQENIRYNEGDLSSRKIEIGAQEKKLTEKTESISSVPGGREEANIVLHPSSMGQKESHITLKRDVKSEQIDEKKIEAQNDFLPEHVKIKIAHRRYFLKTLEELSDENSSWERVNLHRVYIAGRHKYYGITDMESILPIWVYPGASAPEYIELKRSWLFYDEPPFCIYKSMDLPEPIMEFIRDLMKLPQLREQEHAELGKTEKQLTITGIEKDKIINTNNSDETLLSSPSNFLNYDDKPVGELKSPLAKMVIRFLNWFRL